MSQYQDIWPSSGITDLEDYSLPADFSSLHQMKHDWEEKRLLLGSSDQLETFTKQLHRDWAIETGIIENLYDLDRGVTQTLILQGFHASLIPHGSANKSADQIVAMLEDQQAALEGLFDFVKQARKLSISYIKELHAVMTRSQNSTEARTPDGEVIDVELKRGDWKTQPNFPERNGVIYRYCPPEHVDSEMQRLIEIHRLHVQNDVPPELQAAWLHHRFSQIHPFQDGNGRIARALATLIFIRSGLFPMTIPRDEKTVYIEALERADVGDMRSLLYVISRRQRVAYDRAMASLDRIASDDESFEDAAAALGTVYRKRNGVVATRLKERIEKLGGWVYSSLNSHAEKATNLMRLNAENETPAEHAGGGFGGRGGPRSPVGIDVVGTSEAEETNLFERLRGRILNQWTSVSHKPSRSYEVIVRVEKEFRIFVHIYATNPEVEESLNVVAFAASGATAIPLDIAPFHWAAHVNSGDVAERVVPWTNDVIRKGLIWIRRNFD